MDYAEVKRDLMYGFFVVALSLFLAFATVWTVKMVDSPIAINGRTFPWLVTGGMFLLGVSLVWENLRKLKRFAPEAQLNKPLLTRAELKRIALYLVAVCLYILGVEHLGYMVSTFAITFFLLIFSGAPKWAVFIMGLVLPVVMWFCFHVLVEVQFPQALLM